MIVARCVCSLAKPVPTAPKPRPRGGQVVMPTQLHERGSNLWEDASQL
jgi:hypothetical protein